MSTPKGRQVSHPSSGGKDPAAEYGKGPGNRIGSNNLESQVSSSLSSMRSDPLVCYHNKY